MLTGTLAFVQHFRISSSRSGLLALRFLFPFLIFACFGIRASAQGDPATVGQWSSVLNTNLEPTHLMVLPSGQVLFWTPYDPSVEPQILDPISGTVTPTPLPGYQLFCAGHNFLGDSRILVTGGNLGDDNGVSYASIYDPISNTWTRVPDMNEGRWYPTNTTLANGDVLVVSGNISSSAGVDTLPQIFQMATQSWRDLSSAQLSLPLYPRMFLAPNGQVFYATAQSPSRYLDTSGTGAWTPVADLNFNDRDYDTAVMYDVGKIMVAGGGDPPTATAEIIDLTAASPAWRFGGSMATARRQLNGTLLADGKVLITGGSSGSGFDNASSPVFLSEMWDPATEKFTPMASFTQYRGYHSTAALLPDGRVLSGGGDVGGATAEIFSPPYLFHGVRPTISASPAKIFYGQTFSVSTPDAASIKNVNLIRLSSVTHSFNQDQRISRLTFTAGSGVLSVAPPPDPNLAPPGPYMLFILNGSGVPSVAQVIHLGAKEPPTAVASAMPTSGPIPLNVSFSSSGSTDTDGTLAGFAWDFGDGQSSTLPSPHHTYASAGTFTVKLTATDESGATGTDTLFVTATALSPPPPIVNSVSPSGGTQGAILTIVLAGSNFQSGAACGFGSGITASCSFDSPTQLTAQISVNSAAPVGAHDVTVTNPDGQSGRLPAAFTVVPPPTVISISPNNGAQGQNVNVTIDGNNFQNPSNCSFGVGTSVTSCNFTSPTKIAATVSIRSTATPGPRDVTVTNPDAQAGTLAGGFSITPMPSGTIHLDFNYPNRDALMAAGWDFNAMTATGEIRNTEQTGSLAVDYDQTVHPGKLRVPILSGDIFRTTNNSQNTLLRDLPGDWISIRLMIAAFKPVANKQQVDLVAYQDDDNYVLIGHMMDETEQTEFYREQNAVVSTGATAPLTNTGNLLLRMDRDSNSNTYSGFYSLDAGTSWTALGNVVQALASPRLAIHIGANLAGTQPTADVAWVEIIRPGLASPPAISSVTPTSGAQGQTLSVVVNGGGFQSGASCNFGADITMNGCAFNSANQFTANISISSKAAVGARDVTVTNPDNQSAALSQGFSVTAAAAAPALTFSPAAVPFGSVNMGTSTTANVELSNSGMAMLKISSIMVTGANSSDFALVAPTTGSPACSFGTGTIDIGRSCFFGVRLQPASTGSKSASVSVADNASGSPQTVALNGIGADFALAGPSTGMTITAGQTANFAISLTTVGAATANPTTFSATGNPAGTTVTFSPLSIPAGTGSASTTMAINTTDRSGEFLSAPADLWSPLLLRDLVALLALLWGIAIFRKSRLVARPRFVGAWFAWALLLTFAVLTGCNGGAGGSSHSGTGGTPAGTSTITVTATSGSVSRTTTVTLIVQ